MLFAYIDPALGSMVLQAIAGIVLAAMLVGRRILLAPLKWLHLKRSVQESERVESSVEKSENNS